MFKLNLGFGFATVFVLYWQAI